MFIKHTVYYPVPVSNPFPYYRISFSTQYYRKREGKPSTTHLLLCVTYCAFCLRSPQGSS